MKHLGAGVLLLGGLVGIVTAAASGCRSDGRTPLTIYSPHGRDLLGLVEKEYERVHPEVDVRWLDMGSQEVYDRLRSEKANPQADVWYGGPDTTFARAARDGLLQSYRPDWADAVAPASRHEGDLYFGLYRTPAMPVYNSKAIAAADAPREWNDLLDPKWKGKILIRDPLASGTMRSVWGFILAKSVKETGSPAAGFAWLARLDTQTKEYVFNPILLYEKIVRQEGLLTIWDLPDTLLERERGSPLQYVFPKSGTPVIDDALASLPAAAMPKPPGASSIFSAPSRCSASPPRRRTGFPPAWTWAMTFRNGPATSSATWCRRTSTGRSSTRTAPSGWRRGTRPSAARGRLSRHGETRSNIHRLGLR